MQGKFVWALFSSIFAITASASFFFSLPSFGQANGTRNTDTPSNKIVDTGTAAHDTEAAGEQTTTDSQKGKESPIPKTGSPYADEAIRHYNHAVELHQSGFLNQAIAEYRAAIEADKRMEEAYSNLGLIYAAQRNYTKAIESFNKALSLRPARPTTLNGLGTVLYARGKIKEAMEKWQQTVEIDPKFAPAYYNIGNAFENDKDNQAAIEAYAKALKVNPSMADAYYRIGTIYYRDSHPAQALLLLAQAVQLSPGAEFVRDARKEISIIQSQLGREDDEAQVQMNVIAPVQSANDTERQHASNTGTAPLSPTSVMQEPAGDGAGLHESPR